MPTPYTYGRGALANSYPSPSLLCTGYIPNMEPFLAATLAMTNLILDL